MLDTGCGVALKGSHLELCGFLELSIFSVISVWVLFEAEYAQLDHIALVFMTPCGEGPSSVCHHSICLSSVTASCSLLGGL